MNNADDLDIFGFDGANEPDGVEMLSFEKDDKGLDDFDQISDQQTFRNTARSNLDSARSSKGFMTGESESDLEKDMPAKEHSIESDPNHADRKVKAQAVKSKMIIAYDDG